MLAIAAIVAFAAAGAVLTWTVLFAQDAFQTADDARADYAARAARIRERYGAYPRPMVRRS